MRVATGLGILWLAAGLSGCAGYRLGPAGGEISGARSIQIQAFINKTVEPRLTQNLMNSLRKNLMQDGTYRIDTHDSGDIILRGVITGFERTAVSVQSTDVLTFQDYSIVMTADVTARDRSTGKIIFHRPVKGTTTVRAGVDLTSAEMQAIPQITDDLARHTTQLLVDGTW